MFNKEVRFQISETRQDLLACKLALESVGLLRKEFGALKDYYVANDSHEVPSYEDLFIRVNNQARVQDLILAHLGVEVQYRDQNDNPFELVTTKPTVTK